MKVGYARVSTKAQNLDRQLDALTKEKCDVIYQEKASGITLRRKVFSTIMNSVLQEGDILVVESFSRLSRKATDIVSVTTELQNRHVRLIALNEKWDSAQEHYMTSLQLFAQLIQYERDTISERTKQGLAVAHAKGRFGGRPSKWTKEDISEAMALYDEHAASINDLMQCYGASKSTVVKWIREHKNACVASY